MTNNRNNKLIDAFGTSNHRYNYSMKLKNNIVSEMAITFNAFSIQLMLAGIATAPTRAPGHASGTPGRCVVRSPLGRCGLRVPSEVWKAEVQTSQLASCLASGDGGSGNDHAVVCELDRKITIERHVSSFVIYLGPSLLRIGLKDN